MKSYASVDRIEGTFAVCEVEMLDVKESKTIDYSQKETEMIDISLKKVYEHVTDIQEGDILVVEHNGAEVSEVYCKDDGEKQRRIAIIQKIMDK